MDINVAELKAHLSDVLRRVEAGGGPVTIRRHGRPVAVLRGWTPADTEPEAHWSAEIRGVARDLDDFDAIMAEVAASRSAFPARTVELDD